MSRFFPAKNIVRIGDSDRLRCLVCHLEFGDDPESWAFHDHYHRRARELHQRIGVRPWPPYRERLERSWRVDADPRRDTRSVRVAAARNAITADYYSVVDRLLRDLSFPVEEISTFAVYALERIDNDEDLFDVRDEMRRAIENHDLVKRQCRHVRKRDRALLLAW